MHGVIIQVNVKPETPGEHGLPKRPVESAEIAVGGMAGDFNRWRHEAKKDNPDQALLLLPIESLRDLQQEGWPVQPGDIGENVTAEGIAPDAFRPGMHFRIGPAVEVEITEAAEPCRNLQLLSYVGPERLAAFVKTMVGRRGWYARVLKTGIVRRGDAIVSIES